MARSDVLHSVFVIALRSSLLLFLLLSGIVHVVQSESAAVVSSGKSKGAESFDYMGNNV